MHVSCTKGTYGSRNEVEGDEGGRIDWREGGRGMGRRRKDGGKYSQLKGDDGSHSHLNSTKYLDSQSEAHNNKCPVILEVNIT